MNFKKIEVGHDFSSCFPLNNFSVYKLIMKKGEFYADVYVYNIILHTTTAMEMYTIQHNRL